MAREIRIAILGDARDFARAAASAEADAGRFGAATHKMSVGAKVALAGAGAAAVSFAKSSISAFVEAEKSQAQLAGAFEKFPQLVGASSAGLLKLNTELAKKTRFDDDATASGQAVLAQFGLTAKQLTQMTPLLQDYAARTGKSLPDAAKDLGKAINGQGRALKNVGLNFVDTGSAAGNFEQLMGGLNAKVGGFASKEGKTAAGQAAILKNQFGELQEKIGSKLVPVLQSLAEKLLAFGAWLGEHKPVLIGLTAVIGVGLVAAFTAWAVSAASAAAATLAAAAPVLAVAAAIGVLVAGVIWAYQNWGWFRDAVDKVAAFITGKLWPALQTVAAFIRDNVIPVVVAVIEAYARFYAKVAEVAIGVVRKVIEIGVGIANFVSGAKGKFDEIVSFVTGLPGRIAAAASGMWDGIKNAFKAAINWIIRAWNGLEFKIPGFDPPGPGPKFGGFTLGVPNIPVLHKGTSFFNPPGGGREGLALLERGERVTPRGGGGGGPQTIIVQIGTTEIGRVVVEAVSQYERSNGSGWRGAA